MYSDCSTLKHLLLHNPKAPEHDAGLQRQSCVHLASCRTDNQAVEIVKVLLNHGWTKCVVKKDGCDNIPLFCALYAKNVEVVKELLTIDTKAQV